MKILIALFALVAIATADSAFRAPQQIIPNQYIVVLHNHVDYDAHMTFVQAKFHTKQMKHVNVTRHYRNMAPHFHGYACNITNKNVLNALKAHPQVKYVENDGYMYALQGCARQQEAGWNLNRLDEVSPENLDGNFVYSTDMGNGITAYIIDTGIYVEHNDFGGRAVHGRDFTGNGEGDRNGHGTHCAGTVGGHLYGAAKNVSLVAVKVLSDGGSGQWSWWVDGANWVAGECKGKKCVANASLGGGFNSAANDAAAALAASGVFTGIAAGNSNSDASRFSPASADGVYTVGSTALDANGNNQVDERSSFSNYGDTVNIWAPGSDILSAGISGPDSERILSGTSMATPLVVGTAALYWSQHPDLTSDQVAAALSSSGTQGIIELGCRSSDCSASPNVLIHKPCDE